jgi:hypothetical protein
MSLIVETRIVKAETAKEIREEYFFRLVKEEVEEINEKIIEQAEQGLNELKWDYYGDEWASIHDFYVKAGYKVTMVEQGSTDDFDFLVRRKPSFYRFIFEW